MKGFLILLSFCFVGVALSQKEVDLKRKYQGYYEGTIPEYRFQSGSELLFVNETPIAIVIGENQVEVIIGANELFGTYQVMFEAKSYYLLDVKIDGQLANERIMVYKSGKKLSRDGMFPQPVTSLQKVKKRRKKD